ncbi:PPE domain-containing protein [Rhodococcus sp. NPDC055112]
MSLLPSLDELKGSMGDLASGALDDLSDLARDPGNKIIDVVSGYDIDEGNRVEDRQEAGNTERSELYSQQDGLKAEFGDGSYEPPSVVPDSFDSMSHEAIKSAVDAMSADPIRASAEGWEKIGSSLGEGLAEFKQFITDQIDGKWEGVGAEAAMAATTAYVADSDKLAVAGRLVGTKVAEAATGISQVKATMPAVEAISALETLVNVALPSVGMVKQLVHGKDEARQQAIQIMKTVYMPVMQQADTNVPILPRPVDRTWPLPTPDPTSGRPGIGGPSGYNPSGYTGPGDAPVAPTRQGVGNDPSAGSPGTDPSGPNTGANPLSPDGSGADGSNSPFVQTDPSSAWTAPAAASGTDGTGSGLGTGTGTGSGTGSGAGTGSGGHGAGGSGSGLGAGGGSGASYGAGGGLGATGGLGGAGRGLGGGMGMPGAAGGAPGAGGAGGGAAGAAGRPGAMGGGMAPGGARANGDDDTEHKTPSYLVNVDNGNELVGRLPKVAPPVIGG